MTQATQHHETAALVPMREFESNATASIQSLITNVGTGRVSRRQAERLRRATDTLTGVVDNIVDIVTQGENIARSGAQLSRDIEQLATDIDDFQTKRAENETRRAEAAERTKRVATAVKEELRVRTLTASLHAEELQDQLDARRATRDREKTRADQERISAQQRVDRSRVTRDARADAARRKNEGEANRIVRDVQIGAVPADPAHPYHAYAACIYLAAKLDEHLPSTDAAERTREAVLALMLGAAVAPDEITAYHAAYIDLKERAKAAAKHRDTSDLFAAAEAFAGGVQ